jgi:hypothetical protein
MIMGASHFLYKLLGRITDNTLHQMDGDRLLTGITVPLVLIGKIAL